jgi:hypothetical protein
MIWYLFIAAAAAGAAIIASSRRAIIPQPCCPNCRTLLDDLEVERCPNCLLWQPPDRRHPGYRWRISRLLIGLLLIVGPALAWQAGSIARQVSRKAPPAGPSAAAPVAPAALPGGALRRQVQSLGYLSQRGSPARADSQPAVYPSMPDEEAAFYRQMGFGVTTSAPGTVPIDDSGADSREGPGSARQ